MDGPFSQNRSDTGTGRERRSPRLPRPKPFHITEPFQERGLWCFWLTADDGILEYISLLPCILQPHYSSPFQRQLRGRVLFSINPRYDHEETWLWVYELLETETHHVELDEGWEQAISAAYSEEEDDPQS